MFWLRSSFRQELRPRRQHCPAATFATETCCHPCSVIQMPIGLHVYGIYGLKGLHADAIVLELATDSLAQLLARHQRHYPGRDEAAVW